MQENNNSSSPLTSDRSARIAAAIARAKAARDAKASAPATSSASDEDVKAAKAAAQAAKKAQRDEERAKRATARAEKKAAKQVEREARKAAKAPAHMTKVTKAAEKLPTLTDAAKDVLNTVLTTLPTDQTLALADHLRHHVRLVATQQAIEAGTSLKEGDVVVVTGGDAKLIGLTGTLTSVRRIRCLVYLPDAEKEAYLFLSDVAKVTTDEVPVTVEEETEESVADTDEETSEDSDEPDDDTSDDDESESDEEVDEDDDSEDSEEDSQE